MDKILPIKIAAQPDDTTCGPTSLHAIYDFYQDPITLKKVIKDIDQHAEGGGTFAVVLGRHALSRGYHATVYSYNINVFDPSWFGLEKKELIAKLKQRYEKRKGVKLKAAIKEYIKFLKAGGEIRFDDLSPELVSDILAKDTPILTGLSSTWLYQSKRENSVSNKNDDIGGDPAGHFVIVNGLKDDIVSVADPYIKNPISNDHFYKIDINRFINAILLGITSYDGNLLIIERK
ncbi:MAG: hypothetical protein CME71_08050 [Halobacteriovorax sp.]|nr:hypothetical protein [Halobacteriovorax sp.]